MAGFLAGEYVVGVEVPSVGGESNTLVEGFAVGRCKAVVEEICIVVCCCDFTSGNSYFHGSAVSVKFDRDVDGALEVFGHNDPFDAGSESDGGSCGIVGEVLASEFLESAGGGVEAVYGIVLVNRQRSCVAEGTFQYGFVIIRLNELYARSVEGGVVVEMVAVLMFIGNVIERTLAGVHYRKVFVNTIICDIGAERAFAVAGLAVLDVLSLYVGETGFVSPIGICDF